MDLSFFLYIAYKTMDICFQSGLSASTLRILSPGPSRNAWRGLYLPRLVDHSRMGADWHNSILHTGVYRI